MTILTGDATGNIFFNNGSANNGVIQYVHSTDPDSMIINSAGQIEFDAGGAEKVRITSGGVLCVGATAASGSEFLRVKNELLVMNTANTGDAFVKIKAGESGGSVLEFVSDEGDDYADLWRIQNAGDGLLGFRTKASGSWVEKLRIATDGKVTIGGEVHIGTKLVHDGDTDTNINFGANTITLNAGGRTAINCNSNMTEISSPVQYNNARNYSTNSTTTWQTIFTFSVASCPGFSMECAARENNYTTIHRVSGSAQWNSVYYTADFAGDSSHAHSSDIMFRILNDSGTKRLQFKAIQYTTTRAVSIISVWVASGYVTWA